MSFAMMADEAMKEIAAVWGRRGLSDQAVQTVLEAFDAQKRARPDAPTMVRKHFLGAPRPARPRSPDRQASRSRTRRIAAPANVPPHIAGRFTFAQNAVLSVIAQDVEINGECKMSVPEIAARAGVSDKTVRETRRRAEAEGVLTVEERPQRRKRNLTNVYRITDAEWRDWLGLGDRGKKRAPHGIEIEDSKFTRRQSPHAWRFSENARPRWYGQEGLSEGRSGESTPMRPGARAPGERNDRLEAALARAEALLAGRAG